MLSLQVTPHLILVLLFVDCYRSFLLVHSHANTKIDYYYSTCPCHYCHDYYLIHRNRSDDSVEMKQVVHYIVDNTTRNGNSTVRPLWLIDK
ncbi:hypothetical protein BDF22DRAFT_697010 [Syncephalis plumigaleata]|nr:hypothetical protein BDF22DRAFT_697010 [Syncephalis plumigaleata]